MALDACGQAARQVDETLTVPQMTFSDVLSMAGQAAGLSVSSIPCPRGESAPSHGRQAGLWPSPEGVGGSFTTSGLGWRLVRHSLSPEASRGQGTDGVQGLPPHWTHKKTQRHPTLGGLQAGSPETRVPTRGCSSLGPAGPGSAARGQEAASQADRWGLRPPDSLTRVSGVHADASSHSHIRSF